ncbi:MAG: phage terminase large subunit [Acidobacteria bacterium]|nr:phage terminase large subunit [Acidobacteriota bacterium]
MATKRLSKFQATSVKLANDRFNIWEGAVRSSKSVCANFRWLKFVIELRERGFSDKDAPLLMVGKTERTLKRNVIDPLEAMLGRFYCRLNQGEGELFLLGRKVYIAGANDEKALSKIAGLTLMGAYADEISLYPESAWKMLATRLSLADSKLFGTSNPDSPRHYLKVNYLDKGSKYFSGKTGLISNSGDERLDLTQFHFTLDDNPFLQSDFVANLRKEYAGLWKLRYIDGLWVAAEGAIYGMFDPAIHVVRKDRITGFPHIIGIDYGTTNPFVALAIEVRPEGLHIFAELYIDKPLTDSELSSKLQKWIRLERIDPGWICVDPSAASFKRQLYRDGVGHIYSANNDVDNGLRRCASLYNLHKLTMSPDCQHTQDEVASYVWDPEASKKGLDRPRKENDHCCDAKRYGIVTTERIWRNRIAA